MGMGWVITQNDKYHKKTIHKYSFEKALIISQQYKYIYKATLNFYKSNFDGRYSQYLLTNEDLDYLMDFLNKIPVIKMISGVHTIHNSKTLYNIKEKIEVI